MKLIIDIFEEDYESAKQRWARGDSVHKMDYCVSKGIPLDDVKFHIEHMACRQYEHRLMLDRQEVIEILDNIDKAESKDFPQAEDIEPTVKGFVDTMNRWGDLVEEGGEE